MGSGEIELDGWDRVTYVHYRAGDAGSTWDPDGTGAMIFVWFEDANLLVEGRLRVDADLYAEEPQSEELVGYASEVAESARNHLEYGPSEQ